MAKHITEWLNAYLDGELNGARVNQVEDHLAECAECRAELEEMRGLSALLRETAPTGEFISTERFVSNLTLNLPRQPEHSQPRKILEVGWWLTPVGILGTWLFLQVTFLLSRLVLTASNAGLLGNTFASFKANPPQAFWLETLNRIFGNQPGLISMLNRTELFVQHIEGAFFWQALLAIIYLTWLASWWFRQQNQLSNSETAEFQSHPNVETGS
jgi:hypothetical protein